MPRYKYFCNQCEEDFVVFHSWEETQDACIKCESVEIEKLLTTPPIRNKPKEQKQQTGQLTKEYINANKEVLEELKEKARSESYDTT